MADYTLSAKITGDSSGFEKAFSRAQRTLDGFQARTKAFSSRMDKLGDSLSGIGDKLTSKITKPALVATTALGGLTLGKGFGRLTKIDDARAKLQGLGYDAETITEIMNSANQSVKNTSFGLDEAATAASSAAAAGIKPGRELTRYLSLTADAAAVAGVEMGEMGSIFNKVQTSQRAYTEELNQLADRGIPIYQWLADEAGTTADKIKKMASDGEISSAVFLSAIEKNIGGAAKIMGEKSFSAALGNIGAAVGRIGANFLDAGGKGGGFFSQLKPLMVEFRDYLGTLEDKASELGVRFGQAFGEAVNRIKELKHRFDMLPEPMQNAITKTALMGTGFAAALGPALKYLGPVIGGVGAFTDKLGVLSGFAVKITDVKNGFEKLRKSVEGLQETVKIFSGIKEVMLIPFEDLAKKLPTVSGAVSTAWNATGGKLVSVTKTSASSVLSNFGALTSGIKARLAPALDYMGAWGGMAAEAFSPLLGKIASFAPMLMSGMNIAAGAAIFLAGLGILYELFGEEINKFLLTAQTKGPEIITNLCGGIVSKIPDLILSGAALVNSLMNTVTANLPAIIKGGIDIVSSLISGIGQQLPVLIPTAAELIITLVTGLIDNLPAIIDSGITLLEGLADGLIRSVPKLAAAVPKIITGLAAAIISKAPRILETGVRLIVAMGTGLVQAVPQLIGQVPSVISSLWNAFTGVNWWDVGKNIISGIAKGLAASAGVLWDAAMSAAKRALEKAKNFLGIHSPSTVFRDEVGKMMAMGMGIGFEGNVPVQMMIKGIDDAVKTIERQSGELMLQTDAADVQVMGVPSVMSYAAGSAERTYKADSGYANSLDGVVIQVINNTSVDGTPLKETVSDYTIRKIGNRQRAAMRARGAW